MHANQRQKSQAPHADILARRRHPLGGFSLTELLVVIAIIVILVGLLLVALGQVKKRADRTRTESTCQQFATAISAFQTEHNFLPGVIPESVLDYHENGAASIGPPPISSTENVLLHLMGGCRVLSPSDSGSGNAAETDYTNFTGMEINIAGPDGTWKLKINVSRMGEGMVVNGKPFQPYFTPGPRDLGIAPGQLGTVMDLPDLLDVWGQPIMVVKQARAKGPLRPDSAIPSAGAQFLLAGVSPYLKSTGLGERGQPQVFADPSNISGSMLTVGSRVQQSKTWSAVLAHPAFYDGSDPLYGSARGAFALISAGEDGIYYSATDGPGSETDPIDTSGGYTIDDFATNGPKVLNEFNDVLIFRGR